MAYDEIIQEGEDFSYSLKVPKERVAIFIGEKGATKTQLEKELGVSIDVESREGEVSIVGSDSLKLYIAKDVLKAIARGFNPDVATLLLQEENVLEIIDVSEFAHTKDAMQRLKGRLIGYQGKSRKTIEQLTECYLSVYGKTAALIGSLEQVSVAKRAVEALLGGSQHAAVYKWLERQKKSLPPM